MSNATTSGTVLTTVAPENPESADAEAAKTRAGDQPSVEEEPVVRDVNLEMPAGEHIEMPPSIDNNVPVVCLITSCTSSDNP
jgi:hypothetical protein